MYSLNFEKKTFFFVLYKVVLTCGSVDEILNCNHGFKTKVLSSTFLQYCLLSILYKLVLKFESADVILELDLIHMKANTQYAITYL